MKIFYRKGSLFILFVLFSGIFTGTVFGQNMFRKINDFDGDGKADFAVTRNENGNKIWYIRQSANGFRGAQWGIPTDQNIPGDYDGDGKTDFAVFRKSPGSSADRSAYSFWINYSQTGSFGVEFFETLTAVTISGFSQDYDGDGKTDPSVSFLVDLTLRYRSVYVHRQSLSGTSRFIIREFENPLIRVGDVTGDGKSDIVNYNPSSQNVSILDYVTGSTSNVQFGAPGDEYVPADFDGDGKGDLTVFRQSDGTWWWMRSSDNVVNAATFGSSGDVPVPADYDGDGKTDLAIWRSGAQSYFWVYGSQVGVFVIPWGISGDTAVRY